MDTIVEVINKRSYGRPITELDRQRGRQEEDLHGRVVQERLNHYNRGSKRRLRIRLKIPRGEPSLKHMPRTHTANVDWVMGKLAWDSVFRSGAMWAQDAQRKAAKFSLTHEIRFIVSNSPQLGGKLGPLTRNHVKLIGIHSLLSTLDELSQPITSCYGVIDGTNMSNSSWYNGLCWVNGGVGEPPPSNMTHLNGNGMKELAEPNAKTPLNITHRVKAPSNVGLEWT